VGDSNNVPLARRCTTAVEIILAFFARMGAFVCWQGIDCGNNGSSDVLMLAAARVGSGQFEESGWGEEEEEDAGTRQWQCLRVAGRWRTT
jgi:hypothetical protein